MEKVTYGSVLIITATIIAADIKMQLLYVNVIKVVYVVSINCIKFIRLDTNYTVDTSCNNGNIRLVGGINELEGRVEICYNKIWGSVCHNSWSTYDANVVCKQLGYQPTGRYLHKTTIT